MAFGDNKRYAVRVTYRDGSSTVFGPVRSRTEARRLAEQVSGPQAVVRILRWDSSQPGVGGVLSRRPAPVAPAPPVVEDPETPEAPFGNLVFSSPEPDSISMTGGVNLDTVTRVRLYWDNDSFNTFIDPPYTVQTANELTIGQAYGMGLAGQTVSKVELWTGSFPAELAATYGGLSVEIQGGQSGSIDDVQYNSGTDELYVTGSGFTSAFYFNYQGNGTGQLQEGTHFTVDSDSSITVQQASFFLNGGTLTAIDLYKSDFTPIASWTGNVDLF